MSDYAWWNFYIWFTTTAGNVFAGYCCGIMLKMWWNGRNHNKYSEARRRMADRRGTL